MSLIFFAPDHPNMLRYIRIFVNLIPVSRDATIPLRKVEYDTKYVYLYFVSAPPTGHQNIVFFFTAYIEVIYKNQR